MRTGQLVTVREYARLTTMSVPDGALNLAKVSASAFDWLCSEQARLRGSGAELLHVEGRNALRLDNYVGVIETPCGTRIEILPKSLAGTEDAEGARAVLRRMLLGALGILPRESSVTALEAFRGSISEWVVAQFLETLGRIIKRGVRHDYVRVDEQARFVRGRLDIDRQLRQPPGQQHRFWISHDVLSPDRAENRLLKAALMRVVTITRTPGHWRLAQELLNYLSPIPASVSIGADMKAWRRDRLMAGYDAVRPWCALILAEATPLATVGQWHGPSLLFPMERLFERHVGHVMRRALSLNAGLSHPQGRYLCSHLGASWFKLCPDFLIRQGSTEWVLDTKWKLLDASNTSPREKYGLGQSDFYQMFAYGKTYMEGHGDMFLIYPRTERFISPLPCFHFDDHLRLWAVPFDLQADCLILPDGCSLPLAGGSGASDAGRCTRIPVW